MKRLTRFAVTFAVTAGGLLATRAASAQDAGTNPDCTTLPNPVYMGGSSAFVPTVDAFAAKLAAETTPTTLIYNSSASCTGATEMVSSTALTGTATYYTSTGATGTCTFAATGGPKLDVAVADVFYPSCASNVPTTTLPAGFSDFFGPVQAMEIIVPVSNTTTKFITALEADDIWGCGSAADILTFNLAGGIFDRSATSGTQIIIASAIDLDPTAVMGVSASGSGDMVTKVSTFATPGSAIGFVGADVYDQSRTKVSALAFQAYGQTMAYYADSSATAFDRQNVRNGHYFPWGYEHLLAAVDSTGKPTDANAAKIIGLITGSVADATFDYVQLEGKAGTIPLCAMAVQKTNDSPGYLAPYTPTDTCNCAFQAAYTGAAPTSCTACTAGADGGSSCTGGTSCHHGFCE